MSLSADKMLTLLGWIKKENGEVGLDHAKSVQSRINLWTRDFSQTRAVGKSHSLVALRAYESAIYLMR